MDNKDYEDWFGIPLKNEGEELEEGEIKDETVNNSKENNTTNKSVHKSFLAKKRNNINPLEEENNINNDITTIKKVKVENNQNDEEKIKKEKIDEKQNNEFNKNNLNNNINNSNNSNNNNHNQKHPIIEELNNDGKSIIKFNGFYFNKINAETPNLKHYVYLRTQNDFNSETEKMEYKWKIIFTCDTGYIGIGVADKHVVNQNNHIFYSNDKNFYNGTFCLYSVFNRDKNTNLIYQWHPNDPNLNKYAVNLTPFNPNQEITLVYNTFHKTLKFYPKNKNKKFPSFTMRNVTSKGPIPRTILTPCVIFFYPNDTIQIGKLESSKYKERKNK